MAFLPWKEQNYQTDNHLPDSFDYHFRTTLIKSEFMGEILTKSK